MAAADARLELWALVGRLRAHRAVPARLKSDVADTALRISALLGNDASRGPEIRPLTRAEAEAILVELLAALSAAGVAWTDIAGWVSAYRQARPAPAGLQPAGLQPAEREAVHA